jgi:prevent-host-death family protein
MMAHWTVTEAGRCFEHILAAAQNGERQFIDVNGRPKAVLIPITEWDELIEQIKVREAKAPQR